MMAVNIFILEQLLLSDTVDMMVTNLWSFIPSYNNCSHVSDAEFNCGGPKFLSYQQGG